MKKILIILMASMSLSLVGCANNNNATDIPKEEPKAKAQAQAIEIVKCNVKGIEGEFVTTEYKVKNISKDNITFEGLKIVELDKNEDILDSFYSYNQNAISTKLKPDQSVTFELIHDYGKIKKIEILAYEYIDSKDNTIENNIETPVTFNIE